MDNILSKPIKTAQRTKSEHYFWGRTGGKLHNRMQLAALKGLRGDAAEYSKQNDTIFSLAAENKVWKNKYIEALNIGKKYENKVASLTYELNAAQQANNKLSIELFSEGIISRSVLEVLNDEKRLMEEEKEKLEGEVKVVVEELVATKQQHEHEKVRAEEEHENYCKEKERLTKLVDEYKRKLEASELESEVDLERERVEARTKYDRTIAELKTENGALKRHLLEAEKAKAESTKASGSLRSMFSVFAFAVAVFSIWRPLRIH